MNLTKVVRQNARSGRAPVKWAESLGPGLGLLLISRGDWSVFITRPLSAVLIAAAAGLLVLAVLPTLRKKRDGVFVESEG